MFDCKMRLIFVLTALASLSVGVVAADSCGFGPLFWCENRANAEICSAVDYCRAFIWKTASVETDKWNDVNDAKTCTDCRSFVVAVIRLLENESATLIQDVLLEQVCPRSGFFREQCKGLVGNFLKPVTKVLLSAIDPKRTCTAVKACAKNTLDAQEDENSGGLYLQSIDFENLMRVFDHQETSNRTACTTCQDVVKYVQGIFQNPKARNAVRMALEKFVCSVLGPAKFPCKAILKLVIPRLFNALSQLLRNPVKICRFFRICVALETALVDGSIVAVDSTESELKEEIDKVEGNVESDECLICKRIALNFENFLKFNDVSMDNQLNSLCQEFSEQETSLCVSMLKKFGLTLANRLSAVISPQLFCEKVSICPTEREFGKSYPEYS